MSLPSDSIDQERRFGGINRLFGVQALQRLAASHICVIGVGGVGSWAVEALARSGVGALTLIDLDHVAESNINRQLPALSDTLGKAKVQVLAERIALINADCVVQTVEDFIAPDNLSGLVTSDFNWVIDCIDNARTKAALIAHCRTECIGLMTAGGAGGKVDATRTQVTDLAHTQRDPLLARVRRELRQNYQFSRDVKKPFGVAAVWSSEQARVPEGKEEPGASLTGLNCAGFGSFAPVTAGFGLAAAGYVLGRTAEG